MANQPNHNSESMPVAKTEENIDHFIEAMGLFFENQGVPRMAGRILGWLLICEPPEQSMQDIGTRLRASKGSISTTLRILVQFGLVERVSRPGERRDLYRTMKDFSERVLVAAIMKFATFRMMLAQGIEQVDDVAGHSTTRLRALHDIYLFLEDQMPAMIETWRSTHETPARPGSDSDSKPPAA